MEYSHTSVLLDESISSLNINPVGTYVDCTGGGGGHSREIAKRLEPGGRLITIDRDPDAVLTLRERLGCFDTVTVVNDNFFNIKNILSALGISGVSGILCDLGVSSHQLDNAERGFSFHSDAPLDMRMSQKGISAADVVNTYSEQELARIIFKNSGERYARSIAREIVRRRGTEPIETTMQLVQAVKAAMPQSALKAQGHPARRTFQAIRIEVNGELEGLAEAVSDMFDVLETGGRLSIITFHSLEDKIVKDCFKRFCEGCTCPPDCPICICGKTPAARQLKKLKASGEQVRENSRARSATLRSVERLR